MIAQVPNPTAINAKKAAEGDLAGERHVFCVHYQGCLAQAVRAGWEAWSCHRCSLRLQSLQGLGTRGFAEQRRGSWND